MHGIISSLAAGSGLVTGDDGREYVVYGGSFAGGRQKTLAVGDVVEFEPGGKDKAFATNLKLTPYCVPVYPNGLRGPLLFRDLVPTRMHGGYVWEEGLRRRAALVQACPEELAHLVGR